MVMRTSVRDASRRAQTQMSRATLRELNTKTLWSEAKAIDVMASETATDVEYAESYGTTSVPAKQDEDQQKQKKPQQASNGGGGPGGAGGTPGEEGEQPKGDSAEVIVAYLNGSRSHPVILAIGDRRHRLKELEEGDVALYRLKDDRQQALLHKDGTYVSTRDDKKMRIALVPQQQQQTQQQPQATQQAAASGGQAQGAGQQQKQQKTYGQKSAKDDNEKSDTFIEQTKAHNHIRRGKGNVKTEDGQTQTYHSDTSTSTRCDGGHVHIRKGAAKIWVSNGGCHSTVPITIVDCKDDNKGEGQWATGVAAPAAAPTEAERFYLYPPQPSPYDVTSSSPPIQISDGNVAMIYEAPIGLGTGTTPPLILNYVAPLMLDAGGNLTVDPTFAPDLSAYAPLNSPVFTGDPRAPSPALSDNDTSIVTSAWVKGQGYATTALLAGYQPLDADLTALAGLTGTNVIYYRSATNTWSAVTIGPHMTFASGVLDAIPTDTIEEAPTDGAYYARRSLGWTALGTMANQNANAVNITGGSITGIEIDCGTF